MASKKHPGFQAVAAKIQAKEGVSKASPKAKAANPRLKRVK